MATPNVTRLDRAAVLALLAGADRPCAPFDLAQLAAFDLAQLVAQAPAAVAALGAEARGRLTRYRVPRVTEDGTCSRPGDLLPEPFDLLAAVHGLREGDAGAEGVLQRQHVLAQAVAQLAAATAVDWCGVYRRVRAPGAGAGGEHALVKEAYVGAPSRALFPLTAAFAAHSNNSTVGLSGTAILIDDTRALDDATPYYVCDGAVRSELCVPIFGRRRRQRGEAAAPSADGAAAVGEAEGAGEEEEEEGEEEEEEEVLLGIIDAEAFAPRHFTPARVALVLAAAEALGRAALLAPLLPPGAGHAHGGA